jgi:apolipoprotein N-acyltransferase
MAGCFPPLSLPFLLPLGVAALLVALHGMTGRQGFYVGFVFGTTWFLGDLFWLSNLFGMAALSLCAILAVFPACFAALYIWLRPRLPRVPAWLLAPLIWTGIEYYRSEPFVLNFGWLGLGYGVVNVPMLAAYASWFGAYGLTFAIVALGAALSAGFLKSGEIRKSPKEGRKATLCAAVLYGFWLLLCVIPISPPPPVHPLRVRLVQANSEDDESLFRLSRVGVSERADVIVWPEYSFVSDPTRAPRLWRQLTRVAQDNHVFLLFGAKDQFDPKEDAAFRNTAYLLDPNGVLIGRHVKNHPVHFIRDGVAGSKATAISTSLGKFGVAICFDMDYPDVARRLVADGAQVFLVPNDDPPEWGPIQRMQHRLLFQMRAAECGRWLARADVAGGTSVAAPTGQETARVHTTQPTNLDVTVGRLANKTVFVRGGWRFGSLCFLAVMALWAGALLRTLSNRKP